MEALAPTTEQLARFRWQAPKTDQRTKRTAYRRISQAQNLHNKGDIDADQFRAAEKLLRHLQGAAGIRVTQDEGPDPDPDIEEPIVYHGQKVAEARKAIGSTRTWLAVCDMVEERRTVLEIGTRQGIACHKINRGVGLGIVISGLDTLAALWGISQRKPPD